MKQRAINILPILFALLLAQGISYLPYFKTHYYTQGYSLNELIYYSAWSAITFCFALIADMWLKHWITMLFIIISAMSFTNQFLSPFEYGIWFNIPVAFVTYLVFKR